MILPGERCWGYHLPWQHPMTWYNGKLSAPTDLDTYRIRNARQNQTGRMSARAHTQQPRHPDCLLWRVDEPCYFPAPGPLGFTVDLLVLLWDKRSSCGANKGNAVGFGVLQVGLRGLSASRPLQNVSLFPGCLSAAALGVSFRLADPPGSVVPGVQRGTAAHAVLGMGRDGMGWWEGTSLVQYYRDGAGTTAQHALTEQHSISQPETQHSGRYRCCFSSLTKRQSWVLYVPTEGKKFLCLWALRLPRVSSGGSCGTERVCMMSDIKRPKP